MRVAVYYNNRDVRLEERPTPRIGAGEILVRVIASGLCGSDVMEWYRLKKAPLVLGHEIAGEVAAVGQEVKGCKTGDRVFVSHHVPCNTCSYCLAGNHTLCDTLHSTNFDPGGFAEYVRAPAINVDRGALLLPDGVSYEEGTFIEPLGCVLRGLRLANLKPGESVLVIGSGIAGVLNIQAAIALGAGPVFAVDITDYRMRLARRFGAQDVFLASEDVPSRLRKANYGRLADRVIVCAGAPAAVKQALKCVERGGVVLLFAPPEPGLEISWPLFDLWNAGVTLTSTYAAAPGDLAVAIDMIAARRVRVAEMVTHRLPLAETGRGFQMVAGAGESLKIIIEPQR